MPGALLRWRLWPSYGGARAARGRYRAATRPTPRNDMIMNKHILLPAVLELYDDVEVLHIGRVQRCAWAGGLGQDGPATLAKHAAAIVAKFEDSMGACALRR